MSTKYPRIYIFETYRNDALSVVTSEASVDALPFSRCEISEHRACSSSFKPIFSFSATTTTGVTNAPRQIISSPQVTTTPSQKRGTIPVADVSCPGTCSCCGRACSTSAYNTATTSTGFNSDASVEWSVKRLRRKRQFMTSVRHMVSLPLLHIDAYGLIAVTSYYLVFL